jgi:hypothetical protein
MHSLPSLIQSLQGFVPLPADEVSEEAADEEAKQIVTSDFSRPTVATGCGHSFGPDSICWQRHADEVLKRREAQHAPGCTVLGEGLDSLHQ